MSNMVLKHHGILGQQWGKRNGPPYPLGGGDYSKLERQKILNKRHRYANTIYNKKHYDEVLKADKTTLSTVSFDPNRTKDTDMFYAAHTKLDTESYNGLFNSRIPRTIYDKNGKAIGTGTCYKFQIRNSLKKDIKVASEDSAAEIFSDLYKKDRDFYNFVTDKNRMLKYFNSKQSKFQNKKAYGESVKTLDKLKDGDNVTSKDLQEVYRLFNYVIPYDGAGKDSRGAKDVSTQRAKMFSEAKKKGYGALLDTNDAMYGAMKARSPVIVFSMEDIIPKGVYEQKVSDVSHSRSIAVARKVLQSHGIPI